MRKVLVLALVLASSLPTLVEAGGKKKGPLERALFEERNRDLLKSSISR